MFVKQTMDLGGTSFTEAFTDIMEEAVDEFAGAIYEEMEEVKFTSQEVVPLRFGTLRASADAVGVNLQQSGSRGSVTIGYGGAASAYTHIQHETPPPDEALEGETGFRHAAGRTWKYLERPVMEAIDGMEGRIADKVRRQFGA